MAQDSESFNRDLYDLLKVRGYHPTPLDSRNQRVSASQDADVIEFDFVKDGKSYGSAWITVDDAQMPDSDHTVPGRGPVTEILAV